MLKSRVLNAPGGIASKRAQRGFERIALRETATETIQIFRKNLLGEPYVNALVTNAISMSTTSLGAQRYMKAYVYLPVAVHP